MPALEVAQEGDAAILSDLREAAARWQVTNGIVQWSPGEVGLDEIHTQVAAGEWLVLRGDGTGHDEDSLSDRDCLSDGETRWYEASLNDGETRRDVDSRSAGVRAACRLIWSDPAVWGHQPEDAGYVHGLVIDRAAAGTGLGSAVLDLVGQRIRRAGRPFLRLDCVESNPRLREYYRALGFRAVGRREFDNGWTAVVLLERRLTSTCAHAKNPGGR